MPDVILYKPPRIASLDGETSTTGRHGIALDGKRREHGDKGCNERPRQEESVR